MEKYFLFLSHRLETLVDRLVEELSKDSTDLFAPKALLLPNGQVKQWLFLEIAKRKGIAMGIKVFFLDEVTEKTSRLEIYGSLYKALKESTDSEILDYLQGRKEHLLSLAGELTSLFFSYGQHGEFLFDTQKKPLDWQHAILRKLFVEGSLRLPVQTLANWRPFPLICFGIDYLPPLFWQAFFQAPSLSIYLFSPCQEFWEDLCTDRERRSLHRYGKKRGATLASHEQLEAYLQQAPPFLANWGKLGRETLKIFDTFPLQIEELFPPLKPSCLLHKVQESLLSFHPLLKNSEESDDSIRIFQTGCSRLKEVEHLREEILRLGLPYHEIAVLAPQIEPYVPLIEFVFADIPYRISGFDLASQSHFRWGLFRLLHLGRWQKESLLSLFETPSFSRKQGWEGEKLEIFRSWLQTHQVQWGINRTHCQEMLSQTFGPKSYSPPGSWEEGLDRMLEGVVFFRSQPISPDLFEEFLAVILSLKQISLSGEKTPSVWADDLRKIADQFLLPDFDDEADVAAYETFQQFLRDLREADLGEIPFEVVEKFLFSPCSGQLNSLHLHAVRFAPLGEAALLPAKALFLIGMDEESFPRLNSPSSLDLLKRSKVFIPEEGDRERYAFLQALFSAQDYLRISYSHLSATEGKAVGPSFLVQELMSATGLSPTLISRPFSTGQKKMSLWPDFRRCLEVSLPEGEIVISLGDLRALARHPWRFFLQKQQGIFLKEEREESFALQKGRLLRQSLEKPLEELFLKEPLPQGPLGEAIRLEIREKAFAWQNLLAEWKVKPFSLIFRENCREKQWEGEDYICPPLGLCFHDRLTVKLVGEIKQASQEGLLCLYEDQIGGVLKSWPEALAVALSVKVPQICLLKSGKKKPLGQVEESLKAFIAYYFRCLALPSPLLPDWADSLLRKGSAELEKKMEKTPLFADPIVDWVRQRIDLPSAQEMVEGWGPYLKESFAGLIALYPSRSKIPTSSE